ncbi:MAG: hypothetical protein GY754_07770 [bacterium]|nr:hypothetical protein [bacterium]
MIVDKRLPKVLILFLAIFLMSILTGCNRVDLLGRQQVSENASPDPGNSGTISTSNILAASITLDWTKAGDDGTAESELEYRVFRSISANIDTAANAISNGTEITSGWIADINTITATGLTDGTLYYFNVVVKDQENEQSAYTMMYATTTDGTAPTPGAAGVISTSNTLAESINLTWTKAADAGTLQSNLQYKVYRSNSNNIDTVANAEGSGFEVTSDWTADIASFNVTGLTQDTTYYFNVIVMDGSGNKAAYISMSAVTTSYPTVAFSNLSTNNRLESGFIIGTASSSTGTVALVEIQLDSGGYTSATGTTSWNQAIPAGASTWRKESQHTVDVRCRDDSGNYSSVFSTTVRKGNNKDVNGDGYADIGVGSTAYPANTYIGRAYIFHGTSGTVSSTPNTTIIGEAADDALGTTVALGDLDGDGYADFIIGAWNYPAGLNYGRVYIFYGSSSGIADANASAATTLNNTGVYETFGVSLAVGDANGDGYTDLGIGGESNSGNVYIFHGSSGGITSSADVATDADTHLTGETGTDYFGGSIAFGDVNGDGYEDIAVGATGYGTNDNGRVYIFHASSGGISSMGAVSANTTFSGETDNIQLGSSVVWGDINGDGYADIAMGADRHTTDTGRVYIFHGSSGGIASPANVSSFADEKMDGGATDDYYGNALAMGDIDNDGYADLCVGAPKVGADYIGRFYVYLGTGSGINTTANQTVTGGGTYYYLGESIGFSDINGDGYADLIAGEQGYSSSRGQFHLFNGSVTGIGATATTTIIGDSTQIKFGYSVAR